MKTFNVYKHPGLEWQAVKVGFSWPGFCFGAFWMLVKKMWVLAGIFFAIAVVVSFVLMPLGVDDNPIVNWALSLAISLIIGFNGNGWRELNLQKRGYELVASVSADNPDLAISLAAEPGCRSCDRDDGADAQGATKQRL